MSSEAPSPPRIADDAAARATSAAWRENTTYQFASGAAIAIAAVGFARGGRDTWLGVALVILSLLFAIRAYSIAGGLRRDQEHHEAAEQAKLRELIGAHDHPSGQETRESRTPRKGWRRWLPTRTG